MKEHHLQLNLAKTELLVFLVSPTLQHDCTIHLGSSAITPSSLVRDFDVIFDDQLTFKDHVAKTARSYRFALHNIRKTRYFLCGVCCTTYCPGPCHFLTGLQQCSSGWTSIKHNQTFTNASECSGLTGLQ